MDVKVLDKNGKAINPLMGCYGIGITRMVGAAIEQNHDDKGIVWPLEISPFDIHFVLIGKSQEILDTANQIYGELQDNNYDTLFDDRAAGPGFKFKDADLLGVPFQLVLGERDFKESGELALVIRKTGKKVAFKRDQLISKLKEYL